MEVVGSGQCSKEGRWRVQRLGRACGLAQPLEQLEEREAREEVREETHLGSGSGWGEASAQGDRSTGRMSRGLRAQACESKPKPNP